MTESKMTESSMTEEVLKQRKEMLAVLVQAKAYAP